MTVLRLDRFTIDPADTGEQLTRHAALAAVAKDAGPNGQREPRRRVPRTGGRA